MLCSLQISLFLFCFVYRVEQEAKIQNCLPGKVLLASTKSVYVLVPLPLEKQIQDLLANHRVEEALVLTEGAQRNIPKDKFQVCFWLKWPRLVLHHSGLTLDEC